MQISRHWRLNAQRYRLEGFRNSSGEVSLQSRPAVAGVQMEDTQEAPAMVTDTLQAVASTAA